LTFDDIGKPLIFKSRPSNRRLLRLYTHTHTQIQMAYTFRERQWQLI